MPLAIFVLFCRSLCINHLDHRHMWEGAIMLYLKWADFCGKHFLSKIQRLLIFQIFSKLWHYVPIGSLMGVRVKIFTQYHLTSTMDIPVFQSWQLFGWVQPQTCVSLVPYQGYRAKFCATHQLLLSPLYLHTLSSPSPHWTVSYWP